MLPLRFINHKIEDYAMQVTFNPVTGEGDVVYNLALVKNEDLEYTISIIRDAVRSGISVSGLVRIIKTHERLGDFIIPEGCTGIVTMCSSTFDGLLIRRGIQINPLGGGIVEIENRAPIRFTHMILYEYTTIDPLQVLMSQKMTSVTSVMRRGNGSILANIREFHMEAEPLVERVLDELADSSYTGILEVGMPNVPLLGVPVSPQFVAIAAVGGSNPLAAVKESNRWVQTHALKGLMDVRQLTDIRSL